MLHAWATDLCVENEGEEIIALVKKSSMQMFTYVCSRYANVTLIMTWCEVASRPGTGEADPRNLAAQRRGRHGAGGVEALSKDREGRRYAIAVQCWFELLEVEIHEHAQ